MGKICQIFKTQIPFLFVSEKGLASDFIVDNELGIHIQPKELVQKLSQLANGSIALDYNNTFNVEQFSFDYQTDVSLALIDNES